MKCGCVVRVLHEPRRDGVSGMFTDIVPFSGTSNGTPTPIAEAANIPSAMKTSERLLSVISLEVPLWPTRTSRASVRFGYAVRITLQQAALIVHWARHLSIVVADQQNVVVNV